MNELLNDLIVGANFDYHMLRPDHITKPPKPKNLFKRLRVKQYLVEGKILFINEDAEYFKLGKTQTYNKLSDLKCPQRAVYRDIMKDGSIVETVASGWVNHV
jgi:hypothetical protein